MKLTLSHIGCLLSLFPVASYGVTDAVDNQSLPKQLVDAINHEKSLINSKLGPILTDLALSSTNVDKNERRLAAMAGGIIRLVGNKVLVEVVGNTIDNLADALLESGIEVISCMQHVCSVYAAIEQLEEIANIKQVEFLHPTFAITNMGRLTSEGDKAIYADKVRRTFGVNGTGVMVGVLSSSYNCLGGAATNIASGDLPSGVNNILILSDLNSMECASLNITFADEGRAMMQVIHDVAPGARLAFRTGRRGMADFAKGIMELADAGCDIIVDDFTFLAPFFQDGIIAQAVDTVAKRGIPHFSSAGNFGRNAWDEPTGFRKSGINDGLGEYHEFAWDDGTEEIYQMFTPLVNTITPSDPKNIISFLFQWDAPNFSVSGPPGCVTDLNIFVLSGVWNPTIVASGVSNNTGKDAYEFFPLNLANLGQWIPGDYPRLQIRITHVSGPLPKYMKLIVFINGEVIFHNALNGEAATIFGHANADLGAAVGAVNCDSIPAVTNLPYFWQLPSSSAGGTPIIFDTSGNRLDAPIVRKQPRFIGPEGVLTACYDQCFDDYFRVFVFSGTSAAATHVAAAAALMLDYNAQLSPQKLFEAMEKTAIDMDDVATWTVFEPGFDFGTGWGLVNASAAFGKIVPAPAPTPVVVPVRCSSPTSAVVPVGCSSPTSVVVPVEAPSPTPAIVPTKPPTRIKKYCFSDRNTVQVLRGHRVGATLSKTLNATTSSSSYEIIRISDLEVGDYVLTANNLYTKVISFCHRHPEVNTTFVQIHRSTKALSLCTEQSCHEYSEVTTALPPIEMSADHLVYVVYRQAPLSKAMWLRAQDVQVGDMMAGSDGKHQFVSRIQTIDRSGIYAPITEAGTLFVSGTLASSYVAVLKTTTVAFSFDNKTNWFLLFTPNMQHWLGHIILTPLRLLCRYDFAKYCLNETYDPNGYTRYSKWILHYVQWFEWGQQYEETFSSHSILFKSLAMVHWCVTLIISLPFILLNVIEILYRNSWQSGCLWIVVVLSWLIFAYHQKCSPLYYKKK